MEHAVLHTRRAPDLSAASRRQPPLTAGVNQPATTQTHESNRIFDAPVKATVGVRAR